MATPPLVLSAPDDLDLQVDVDEARARVTVRGEVDAGSSTVVARAVAMLAGAPVIALDLDPVTYLDAAGVGAVLRARDEAAAAGSRLVVVGAAPRVRDVFELCGLGAELAALRA